MSFVIGGKMGDQKALVVLAQYALVPTNVRVVAISNKFGWKPKTLIRRIEKSLQTVMEQQVYMMVAKDFGIHPESMKKLLKIFLGHKNLEMDDLISVSVGRNLVFSPFKLFAEYLRESLSLLRTISSEYSNFTLSIEQAGVIVLNYGTEDPERVIEMIDNNLDQICKSFGVYNKKSDGERIRQCIMNFVSGISENHLHGCPEVLDPSDFEELLCEKRNQLRRVFASETPDYLSGNFERMRVTHNELYLLKTLEVI